MEETSSRADWRDRFGRALDRAEQVYLRILRAAVLIVATALVAFAIWLAVTGVYKVSRSPDSVVEKNAVVSADDLVVAPIADDQIRELASNEAPIPSAATRQAYKLRLDRYFDVYRTRFEPFRQPDDKQLSRDEFDDQYLRTRDRAQSVANGELNEARDLTELDRLILVLTEAAADHRTNVLLRNYKAARKVDVRKTVERVRSETRRGWNSSSMACSDWYLSPYGCPTVQSVEVPYTETVTVKEFPKGTLSHAQIFKAYHNRYLELLAGRRDENRYEAEAERQSIIEGKVAGGGAIWFAIQLAAAFLALMFFFLLIAIERHQRRLSEEIGK
jgi:hypothetical protein